VLWYRDSLRRCGILNRMRYDGTGHVGYALPGAQGLVLDGSDGFVGLGNGDFFDPVGEVVRFSL
jgi:hypothetical protein